MPPPTRKKTVHFDPRQRASTSTDAARARRPTSAMPRLMELRAANPAFVQLKANWRSEQAPPPMAGHLDGHELMSSTTHTQFPRPPDFIYGRTTARQENAAHVQSSSQLTSEMYLGRHLSECASGFEAVRSLPLGYAFIASCQLQSGLQPPTERRTFESLAQSPACCHHKPSDT